MSHPPTFVHRKLEPPKDRRDCPRCHVRMEEKGVVSTWENGTGGGCDDTRLWQCPECKNVEIL